MTEVQVLWSINTLLLGVLFYVIKLWITKIDKKLDVRPTEKSCDERHRDLHEDLKNLYKHKHAPTSESGQGGEVIIP